MIGSISLQERLQMKREPLDQWSIREKLCLATAVMRSGDQNWMSVSRALKPFGEPNRPADWFHQKNCAAQYGALLEQIETPKRKKRSSFGSMQEPPQLETPAESILKNLQAQRQEELKQLLAEEKKEYLKLQEDMRLLHSGQVSEEQLDEWCLAIEEEERQKDLENAEYSTWLKEREERKQELERVWRPAARPPIGLQQTNIVGQKRKALDESLDLINTSLIVQQVEIDNSEETKKSPTVTNPETPTKPALSPLLTSLLKSPSSHQQQQQGAPQHASILHTAITQQTPPKVASTTINPTIASLLNRSASVTVSPGIQQLVTSAISSAEPTPIPAPIISIRQSANQLPTSVTDLLSDSEVPNLKDIEKTISIDHPLPEMKNEEVDTIISDLIDNNDIVTDPEKHLLDVNDDDIINSLENELEELANEEKAAIAYAAAAIVANESDCGDSHVKTTTETVQDEVGQFVQETEHSPKVVNLQPVVLLTSTSQNLLHDIVKEEVTDEEVIESPVKVATPEKSTETFPEKNPENEVVEIKEEKAKIEIDPFEFQEDPEIQPSKPSAGLKLVSQQSQNQMENKINNENILIELQSSKTLVKENLLRHSTETKELRKSITEIVKIEQKEIQQEQQLASTIGSVEIVEVDVLEDEENSNDSYKSKASDESNIKLDVSDIATTKPEVLSIDQKSPVSVKPSPVKVAIKVEISSTAINEDESSTRTTLVDSMIEAKVDVSKTDSISEEVSDHDQDLKVKEDDNIIIIALQTSVKKSDLTEVKEAPEIKHENVESTPSRTFTPDYSNSMGDIFDDMNIGMKVSRVKRDYSRTKKKEDSADIDLLLAVEKAANENLHNDEDYDEDQTNTLEPAHPSCEGNKQHTASKTNSKLVSIDAGVQTKAKHLKEQVADDSNSPWTEEEEVAITTASSVAAPSSAHPRSTRRRYSTPATPVDSVPSSPASSFDDDRDYRNWKKAVLLVHGRLAMHKYASLFMKGVTNDQAPSYHDLVYRPMDLQTIRKNVDSGVIRTNGEFQRDVLLMLANAIMYNDVGSQIYEMAVEMRKEAHEQLQILHQAQQGGDAGPSRRERRTTDQQLQQQQVVGKRKRTSETEAPRTAKKRRDD